MTQIPEPCLGRFLTSQNTPARSSCKPESNKALILPILQCATAREETLGLSPFSAKPGALDGCESRDPRPS